MGHPHASPADQARARILAATIQLAACRHGVDPILLAAVAVNESNLDPNRIGDLGERGRWQMLPATARELGFIGSDEALARDPINANLAAAWLAHVKAVCAKHGHRSEAAYVNAYRGAGCRRITGRSWPTAYARRIIGLAGMAREVAERDPGTAALVGSLNHRSK